MKKTMFSPFAWSIFAAIVLLPWAGVAQDVPALATYPCTPDTLRANRDDIQLTGGPVGVTVQWKADIKKDVTLVFRKPVPLPDSVLRGAIRVRNIGGVPLKVSILFKTATGSSFAYPTEASLEQEWRRLDTPVMGTPVSGESASWDDRDYFPPPPYLMTGIRLSPRVSDSKSAPSELCGVDIQNIDVESVARDKLSDYWVILPSFPSKAGGYADFTETPALWGDRLVSRPGHYRVVITAASVLNGPVVWSSSQNLDYGPSNPFASCTMNLPKGYYWVTARVYDVSDHYLYQHQFVVDVERRSASPVLVSNPEDMSGILQVTSSKSDNLFALDEMPSLRVQVPIGLNGSANLGYEMVDFVGRQVLPSAAQLVQKGDAFTLPLRRESLRSGEVYNVKLRLKQGDRTLDESTVTFGVRSAPAPFATSIPPLSQAPLPGPLHMAPIQYWGPLNWGGTHQPLSAFQELVDLAKKKGFACVSIGVYWWAIEPLPGVYRFEDLDAMIALVKKAGLKVFVELDGEPPWINAVSRLSDKEGQVHNLWYGGGAVNLIPSPSDRGYLRHLQGLWKNLAAHYAADSEVVGYSFLGLFSDHFYARARGPGLTAQKDFQFWLQKKSGGSLKVLNKRWGSDFSDWSNVSLPRPATDTHKPDFRPAWGDYIKFKNDVYKNYIHTIVDAIRSQDGKAWVQLYWMGGNVENKQVLNYLQKNGGLTGDGGSEGHDLSRGSSVMQVRNMSGITESIQQMPRNRLNVDMLFTPLYYGGRGAYFRCLWNMDITGSSDTEKKKDWLDCINYLADDWKPVLNELASTRAPNLELGVLDGGEVTVGDYIGAPMSGLGWAATPFTRALLETHLFPKFVDLYSLPNGLDGVKMLWVLPNAQILTDSEMIHLVQWVKGGGHLVASVSSGRWSLKQPEQDFALMKQLGMSLTLQEGRIEDRQLAVSAGGIFKASYSLPLSPFGWDGRRKGVEKITPKGEFQTLASFSDGSPALIKFSSGKGEVVLFLGNVNMDDFNTSGAGRDGHGILDDLTSWGGAWRTFVCDQPEFALSLLEGHGKKYLLVHRIAPFGKVHDVPMSYNLAQPRLNGVVRLVNLAENSRYHVQSIKGPAVDLTLYGKQFAGEGLPVANMILGETRVFKLEESRL